MMSTGAALPSPAPGPGSVETRGTRTYCFDIDGTLCTNTWGEYEKAEPISHMIAQVSALYDVGHTIILFSARGTTTGRDWGPLTKAQMERWQCRYHALQFGKPQADVYVDDRGMSIEEWMNKLPAEAKPSARATEAATPASETADNIFEDPRYIDFLYSEKRRPKSDYPAKLAAHLRDHWFRGKGTLLDIGCGRGDMLKALFGAGYEVAGVDLSPVSIETCKPHTVKVANLETEALPFAGGSFEYVFSKSVIEHLHNPMPYLKQALRVLAPGGAAVIMTPSWMHHRWGPFYLDYTHVTPFTLPSLRDAMTMAGFADVEVVHFHQLPFLWKRPWLTPAVRALALLPLRYRPMYDVELPQAMNTLFRFSKEVMLLGVGRRPGV